MPSNDPRIEVHEALKGFIKEDEIITKWCVVVEVHDVNGTYLLHRAGGGIDGDEAPRVWTALGMLRSGEVLAEAQLRDNTR